MASLLRQIVAGPRSRHPEAGLDLCYVTSSVIATSGPSGTYPQKAYRNPLSELVKFLDYKHGKDGWQIWEFRAEGTGYPDEEVRGQVKHYPWPDHHPPPFRLVPMIVAGMRNWIAEGQEKTGEEGEKEGHGKRVIVVHCKAGKGRSGTMACSYLIAECGWKASDALARFTERRMRPGFGQGVSIPSQVRWVGYVDRWAKSGKVYVERQIEIMEVHVWGLRDGVKVQVEGYVDEGKKIKLFHLFTKQERVVIEGNAPGGGGIKEMLSDMAGFQPSGKAATKSNTMGQVDGASASSASAATNRINTLKKKAATAMGSSNTSNSDDETGAETGGEAVVFKPATRVILPSSDINIDFERRNKASMGWTMVTSVAHVWFNAYFEGNGPEKNGLSDDSGTFEIDWDKMDGIKGSSRKGTRAFDKLAVVWKAYEPGSGHGRDVEIIHEPGINSPVPEMEPADWKGDNQVHPSPGKELGLRTESPITSRQVSKANSVSSNPDKGIDQASIEGVKPSNPDGDENLDEAIEKLNVQDLPEAASASVPDVAQVNAGLDTASGTTAQRDAKVFENGGGISTVRTGDLPDGVPEDELRDAKDHKIGHLQLAKKTMDS